MNFNDTINIHDSLVKGFVILKDQNGKTLFQKNNMVVNGGRNSIYNMICCSIENSISDRIINDGANIIDAGNNNIFSHFSSIKFGSGNDITTLNTANLSRDLSEDENAEVYNINIETVDTTPDTKIDISYTVDDSRCITFELTIPATSPAELTELGLFYKSTSTTDTSEKLFSRVVFDPIYCGPNAAVTELKLTYNLYF